MGIRQLRGVYLLSEKSAAPPTAAWAGDAGRSIRVLVVDDHRVVRDGLRFRLERGGFSIVGEASTGAEAVAKAAKYKPDVVLLDLGLPDRPGAAVCAEILAAVPSTVVVVLSAHADDRSVGAALDAGASSYLLKDAEDVDLAAALIRAVRGESVLDPRAAALLLRRMGTRGEGRPELSEQERRILQLAAEGLTNREIGARLYLSRHTVKEYLSNAMRKLDVGSRVEAALEATRLGLIDPPAERRH